MSSQVPPPPPPPPPPGYPPMNVQPPYAMPRRTAGSATACFVLSLVGLFCLSIAGAIPSFICGIVGLNTIKSNPQTYTGKGLIISGLIISSLTTLIFLGIVYLAVQLRPKEFVVQPPAYKTLYGEGFSGRGFHFLHNGRTYLGCSLHQFDNATPAHMLMPDLNTEVPITGRHHSATDIQILTYTSPELDLLTPLPYKENPRIRIGDPVYLLDDPPVKGHVIRKDSFSDQWIFEPDSPFEAQARSGSPILSGLTGDVIGIFLTADSADHATWGGFEPLTMP